MKENLAKVFLRVLKRVGLLSRVNFSLRYYRDSEIKIPIINSLGHEHFSDSEDWLLKLLGKLIPLCGTDNCFLDVGVNIGQTLIKVKCINKRIHYLGFEPNPSCLYYLYNLIRLNGFTDVSIIPCALSSSNDIRDLTFYSEHLTDSSASIVPGFRSHLFTQIKVPTLGGQDLIKQYSQNIGIIKIDVEGSELEVVTGLVELIERDRPFIICEVLPVYSSENIARLLRQQELENILSSEAYSILLITMSGVLEEISSFGIHSDVNRINYLFYPNEKKEIIVELNHLFNESA